MTVLTFPLLKAAWNKLRQKREKDLLKLAPDMTSLNHVYMKLLNDDGANMNIQFAGLENSVNNTSSVPQVKNLIIDWLRRVSTSVKISPSNPTTLSVLVSKESNMLESAPVQPVERKIKSKPIQEHKYERDLGLDRVKIIMKV